MRNRIDFPEGAEEFDEQWQEVLKQMPSLERTRMDADMSTKLKDTRMAEPGDSIGRFQLECIIGRGGQGEVWLAYDPLRPEKVAIKILSNEMNENCVEFERTLIAYRKVHELDHPNICPLYDIDVDEMFGCYVVMEFIPGVTLDRYRWDFEKKHGRFSTDEMIRILKPVAEALDYSHRHHVVHRNIHTRNILMLHDGKNPKLVDFDLEEESIRSDSTVAQSALQRDDSETSQGQSTEQRKAQLQDNRTDQYDLAVMAYELLAGQPPFGCDIAKTRKVNVLKSSVPKHERIPPSIRTVIETALAEKREDRFPTCRAFVDALEATVKKHGADTAELLSRSSSKERSNNGLLLSLLLGIFICLAGLVALFGPDYRHVPEKSETVGKNPSTPKFKSGPKENQVVAKFKPSSQSETIISQIKPSLKKWNYALLNGVWKLEKSNPTCYSDSLLEVTEDNKALLVSILWERPLDMEVHYKIKNRSIYWSLPRNLIPSEKAISTQHCFVIEELNPKRLILKNASHTHYFVRMSDSWMLKARKSAQQAKQEMNNQRSLAEEAQGKKHADEEWTKAVAHSSEGQKFYKALKFKSATTSWQQAAQLYRLSKEKAVIVKQKQIQEQEKQKKTAALVKLANNPTWCHNQALKAIEKTKEGADRAVAWFTVSRGHCKLAMEKNTFINSRQNALMEIDKVSNPIERSNLCRLIMELCAFQNDPDGVEQAKRGIEQSVFNVGTSNLFRKEEWNRYTSLLHISGVYWRLYVSEKNRSLAPEWKTEAENMLISAFKNVMGYKYGDYDLGVYGLILGLSDSSMNEVNRHSYKLMYSNVSNSKFHGRLYISLHPNRKDRTRQNQFQRFSDVNTNALACMDYGQMLPLEVYLQSKLCYEYALVENTSKYKLHGKIVDRLLTNHRFLEPQFQYVLSATYQFKIQADAHEQGPANAKDQIKRLHDKNKKGQLPMLLEKHRNAALVKVGTLEARQGNITEAKKTLKMLGNYPQRYRIAYEIGYHTKREDIGSLLIWIGQQLPGVQAAAYSGMCRKLRANKIEPSK